MKRSNRHQLTTRKKEKTVNIDLQTKSQIDAAADIESAITRLESERQGVLAQKRQLESYLRGPRAQADPYYQSRLNMIEQIKTKLSGIEAQKILLRKQLKSINNQLSNRPQEEVNLTRFLRDEKIADKTYSDLLSKLQELEIQEAAKTASIKLIEEAIPAKHPVAPNKAKSIILALAAGILLGFSISLFLIFLKDIPYSLKKIKTVLPYNVLGTVPVVQKNDLLFFKESTNSIQIESIRHIHNSIDFIDLGNSKHVNIIVTSATAGEGKRVICSNLAYIYSETGKSVALVNLDLRRNVFKDLFNSKNNKGITDFLIGKAQFEEICSTQPQFGFDIFDTGKKMLTPVKILKKNRVDELFKILEKNYDVCLFYGAPICSAAETLDLSRRMIGIILVSDMKTSNMKSIAAMQELIKHKDLLVLGTVINRIEI